MELTSKAYGLVWHAYRRAKMYSTSSAISITYAELIMETDPAYDMAYHLGYDEFEAMRLVGAAIKRWQRSTRKYQ